ncbi:HdeD family acid-resistance protein [Pyxidicoccus parkwayensis]|uniref:HdeD family acid-resistance protein n=1 Tax=Pyxidicoccus parkwayensis TaxID=2813578 RepID=A0ABX7P8B9_9BACT|nr:HdeD family acid-resistance protein [Pyxidicoccus parkwaysis]QSQ26676.1 HdeD family acid-resistance protein [Pyxidicoccus parkwaysis]
MDLMDATGSLTELRNHRGWFLILGVALMLLGGFALRAAVAASLVSVVTLGVALIVGGVAEVIHAFGGRHSRGFTLHLLAGVLSIVVGALVVRAPVQSAVSITLLIIGWLAASGIFRIFTSLFTRQEGWGWELANGVISLALGLIVWSRFPASAMWLIGTFVGIEILFRGISWIVFSLGLRGQPPRPATPGV